ncbi:MAG: ribonuclease HII [Candidatus Rokubacteria bacterium]|nr:ribonuclease HII [Candidatus Rokubacteria bacterium]
MGAPYRYEGRAWRSGLKHVAGVDEAGRGPLAGPVVAAAVILHPERRIKGLEDSKLLTPGQREIFFEEILEHAAGVETGIVDPETIDRVNILEATRLAMHEALTKLTPRPDLVLIDAVRLSGATWRQRALVRGDRRSASIAAASIVAKVTRDWLMVEADILFPQYGFIRHKGYPTPEHLAALRQYGPCPIHRRTFHGVWMQGELFSRS